MAANRCNIPKHELEILARHFLPQIQAFFESEEGRKEYEEWKAECAEKLILRLLQNLKPSETVLFSTGFNGIERDEWLFEDINTILCEMQRSGYTFSYVSGILNRYRK